MLQLTTDNLKKKVRKIMLNSFSLNLKNTINLIF